MHVNTNNIYAVIVRAPDQKKDLSKSLVAPLKGHMSLSKYIIRPYYFRCWSCGRVGLKRTQTFIYMYPYLSFVK
jgi:hypothetical protein